MSILIHRERVIGRYQPTTDTGERQWRALSGAEGDRRETTDGVPHIQFDAVLVPEVDAELVRRAYSLPGVREQESELSLPGIRSLWLADAIDVARTSRMAWR